MRRALLILATATLAACGGDPVERELVGSWQSTRAAPAGALTLNFTTQSNGEYRTEFSGPQAPGAETGRFAAADGDWRLETSTGHVSEGTYEFLTDDSVLFRSPAGGVVWTRLAVDAASHAAAADTPAPAPAAAVSAARPATTTGAAPALNPSASFAPPNGMPLPPAPFGIPKATPSSVFSESYAGLPASPPRVATAAPPRTATSAESAPSTQTAPPPQPVGTADAGADAGGPGVGQRVQRLTGNARSKLRNFFNRDNDDESAADDDND
jgi:hypothetical protein